LRITALNPTVRPNEQIRDGGLNYPNPGGLMQLSARNQLRGRITSVRLGAVMAEIAVDVGAGNTLVSAITRASAEALHLAVGDEVTAVIKSTEVIIAK
jgi:molybdopterin-binding protein